MCCIVVLCRKKGWISREREGRFIETWRRMDALGFSDFHANQAKCGRKLNCEF